MFFSFVYKCMDGDSLNSGLLFLYKVYSWMNLKYTESILFIKNLPGLLVYLNKETILLVFEHIFTYCIVSKEYVCFSIFRFCQNSPNTATYFLYQYRNTATKFNFVKWKSQYKIKRLKWHFFQKKNKSNDVQAINVLNHK